MLDFRESNFKKTLCIPLIDYTSLGRNLTRSQNKQQINKQIRRCKILHHNIIVPCYIHVNTCIMLHHVNIA